MTSSEEALNTELQRAYADIAEYWHPALQELKAKCAKAQRKIGVLNRHIARLEEQLYTNRQE